MKKNNINKAILRDLIGLFLLPLNLYKRGVLYDN
nr:MAG TPA: hypothetical protein [Caudoviricetes sp.]